MQGYCHGYLGEGYLWVILGICLVYAVYTKHHMTVIAQPRPRRFKTLARSRDTRVETLVIAQPYNNKYAARSFKFATFILFCGSSYITSKSMTSIVHIFSTLYVFCIIYWSCNFSQMKMK